MPDMEVADKEQLLAQMKEATDKNDWKAVSKISSQIAKVVVAEEKAVKDAQLAAVAGLTEDIKKIIDKAITKWVDGLPQEQVEALDGVWYGQEFGGVTSCKVVKGAVRTSGGGGGGGKKFAISTNDLLAQHGDKVIETGDDQGKTFNEAYAALEKADGNGRYRIRMKLLKVAGLS